MKMFADVFVTVVALSLAAEAIWAGIKFLRRRLGFRLPWRKR